MIVRKPFANAFDELARRRRQYCSDRILRRFENEGGSAGAILVQDFLLVRRLLTISHAEVRSSFRLFTAFYSA
jgi:hypothetical protein